MSTGYLNQSSILSSVYVGWDGLTPPTLPIGPWAIKSGGQPGDFTLASDYSSVTLMQNGSANSFEVIDPAYPVTQTQQQTGFRIGAWVSYPFPLVGVADPFGLGDPAGFLYHNCRIAVDASNNWSAGCRINTAGTTLVPITPGNANSWHFIAMEAFNGTVTLYVDMTDYPVANVPPTDQSENVTVVNQFAGTANIAITLSPDIACFSTQTRYLHLRLTLFKPAQPIPTPQLAGGLPGGEGYPIPLAPYQRYKAIRAAVDKYNSLQLGP